MSRRFGDLAGSGGDSGREAGALEEEDVDTQVAQEVERMQKARKAIRESSVENQEKLPAENEGSSKERRRDAKTGVAVGDMAWKTDNSGQEKRRRKRCSRSSRGHTALLGHYATQHTYGM